MLRTEFGQLVCLGGHGAVVAEAEHDAETVFRTDLEIGLEIFHKAVVLTPPDLIRQNRAHGIETGVMRQLQLGAEAFLDAVVLKLLPLLDAVDRAAGNIVKAANPRAAVEPFPRLFLGPFLSHCFFLRKTTLNIIIWLYTETACRGNPPRQALSVIFYLQNSSNIATAKFVTSSFFASAMCSFASMTRPSPSSPNASRIRPLTVLIFGKSYSNGQGQGEPTP